MTYDELDELDYFHLTESKGAPAQIGTDLQARTGQKIGPDMYWTRAPESRTSSEHESQG